MTARRTVGPDANVERVGADLYRETRTGSSRFRTFLKSSASSGVLGMAALAIALEPGTVDALLPLSALYAAWVLTRRVVLPLRLPVGANRLDYNHPHPKNRRPRKAAGILYIGRDYKTGQELWISNEDGRQHVAVPGTTGAGKTVALVSLCANALAWGSGFIFVDGKADNRLYADVLALARLYGREDDVLALNFLVASGNKDSATFNPFAWGNADVIRELLVSQIEANPGGDKGGNHVFMARAVALLGALTPALVWMRDKRGVPIDIESIRFATELESIVSLAINKTFRRRNPATGEAMLVDVSDIDEALLYPLSSYLGETGGYDKTLAFNKQKSDEPSKQHSFVVMHFSATFTQLAVSLGHIFKCEIGDIDMRDVVLNRRITAFVPDGPIVVGIDETIERRWGTRIKARGIYRDPVRSSHGHFVKASGLRWISVMLLAPIPFAGRVWALPFLTTLAPSERYAQAQGRRHKLLTDWARQLLLLVARWLPGREIIAVADSSYAAIELLAAVRRHVTVITRLRLDARLFDPPPPRLPGTKGRPRVSGARQPTLLQRLANPETAWQRVTVTGWYGQGERQLDVVSGTSLWYHPGKQVPTRWVLVRDVAGGFEPQAFLCTDQAADPITILKVFVRRWSIEVTFAEVRRHLGVETQRQWSDLAIARTTPCLLALFSLATLWASDLAARDLVLPRRAAWYAKPEITFSDALAAVRRQLWIAQAFSTSPQAQNMATIPRALLNSLTEAACYPA